MKSLKMIECINVFRKSCVLCATKYYENNVIYASYFKAISIVYVAWLCINVQLTTALNYLYNKNALLKIKFKISLKYKEKWTNASITT